MGVNSWFSSMVDVATDTLSRAGENIGGQFNSQTATEAIAIGAHNRKIRQEEAAHMYQRRTTAKRIAYKVFNRHLKDNTKPAYFEDRPEEEWTEFKKTIERKYDIEGSAEYAIKASDLYKIQGLEALSKYGNDTNLAPLLLGGPTGRKGDEEFMAKRLSEDSQVVRDTDVYATAGPESLEQSLYLIPSVRVFDTRTGVAHSGDMTKDGTRMRDYPTDEEAQANVINRISFDHIDQLDYQYGERLQREGKIQGMTRTLPGAGGGFLPGEEPQDPSLPIQSAELRNLFTDDEFDEISNRNTSRARTTELFQTAIARQATQVDKSRAKVAEIQAGMSDTEKKDVEAFDDPELGFEPGQGGEGRVLSGINAKTETSTSDPNVPPTTKVVYFTGEEVRDALMKKMKRAGGSGEIFHRLRTYAANVEKYGAEKAGKFGGGNIITPEGSEAVFGRFMKSTSGNPWGVSDDVWGQMGKEGRIFAAHLETEVDKHTRARIQNKVRAKLIAGIKERRRAGDIAGLEGSSRQISEVQEDKAILKWFAAQGMGRIAEDRPRWEWTYDDAAAYNAVKDSRLMKFFRANPSKYKEYEEDPHAFALRYMNDDNGLYGLPVKPSEKEALATIADAVDMPVAEKAIEEGDKAKLIEEVRKLKDSGVLKSSLETALVEMNRIRDGNMYRFSKRQRIASWLGYLSALPENHVTYQALLAGDAAKKFAGSGDFDFTQQDLAVKQEKIQLDRFKFINDLEKERISALDKLRSGDYSAAGKAFGTAVYQSFKDGLDDGETAWTSDSPHVKNIGALITNETGRLADAMRVDSRLSNPKNRQDYGQLMRMQMQLIKYRILAESEPSWWASWFVNDPDAQVLTINPNVIVRDINHKRITDPKLWEQAYVIQEKGTSSTVSAAKLKGDFGNQVLTALIWASLQSDPPD